MASKNAILESPKLDLSVNRYAAFKTWKDRWEHYVIVTKLAEESAGYQASLLRYSFTEDTRKIHNLSEAESKASTTINAKLESFAKGTINETMERHILNLRNQEEGEEFDDFITEIKNCNFCGQCHDGLIRDKMMPSGRNCWRLTLQKGRGNV